MKKCPKCGEVKPHSEYHKNKSRYDGLAGWCKVCWAKRQREKGWKSPAGKAVDAARKRDRVHGLEPGWYERKLEEQNGVCAICWGACQTGKNLAVDHDHLTGEKRGLLCMDCNTALGKFRDNPIFLQRAIEYLALGRK